MKASMKKECNDCGKCPYFGQSYDYWGECDEWCELHFSYSKMGKCKYSMITRKLISIKVKIQDAIADWRIDIDYKKQLDLEYKERIKLGMTQDEYDQYLYDESMK